jgi:hypothetical protein
MLTKLAFFSHFKGKVIIKFIIIEKNILINLLPV